MKQEVTELEVNGVKYIRADSVTIAPAKSLDGMPYVIVRTYSAGVFAGYLKSKSVDRKHVFLVNARRLWYWVGAASLSQLAMEGVKNPGDCKFPCEVNTVELTEVVEILTATAEAKASIDGVPIWKK